MSGFNVPRSRVVRDALRKDRLIPLRELLRMSQREFYNPAYEGVPYAQAWSFVYFLMKFEHKDKKIRERVRNFNID